MALSNGPNLGLLVNGNQGEAHYADLMKFLRGVDGLVMPSVKDKDLTSPPGSPTDGDRYIVASGATGAWAGQTGKITRWSSVASAWEFYAPMEGWVVHVDDEDIDYKYSGTAWSSDFNTGKVVSNADVLRLTISKTPASASDTGNAGEICWDSNYVYVCVAANTWKRAALSTW